MIVKLATYLNLELRLIKEQLYLHLIKPRYNFAVALRLK
jgi:hypothetical protein